MAQALSSAGEVRNGSSRIKLGVCLRCMGYQISAAFASQKFVDHPDEGFDFTVRRSTT
jgi:hypothetical protein